MRLSLRVRGLIPRVFLPYSLYLIFPPRRPSARPSASHPSGSPPPRGRARSLPLSVLQSLSQILPLVPPISACFCPTHIGRSINTIRNVCLPESKYAAQAPTRSASIKASYLKEARRLRSALLRAAPVTLSGVPRSCVSYVRRRTHNYGIRCRLCASRR